MKKDENVGPVEEKKRRGYKRSSREREAHLPRIAELYLEGKTQGEIGAEIGVHQSTVCRELAGIRQRWVESSLVNFDEAKRRELAVVDRVEAAAWEGWRESQKPKETSKTSGKRGGPVETAEKEVVERAGNPRFLDVILKCVERRCAILGLNVERHELVGAVAHEHLINVDQLAEVFRQMGQYETGLLVDGNGDGNGA